MRLFRPSITSFVHQGSVMHVLKLDTYQYVPIPPLRIGMYCGMYFCTYWWYVLIHTSMYSIHTSTYWHVFWQVFCLYCEFDFLILTHTGTIRQLVRAPILTNTFNTTCPYRPLRANTDHYVPITPSSTCSVHARPRRHRSTNRRFRLAVQRTTPQHT